MSDRRKVLETFESQRDVIEKRAQDIERHRKGDAKILLKDRTGKPLANLAVTVRQKTHAFKYGANLFMLDEMETQEKNDLYRQYMRSFGNMATLPFYWNATEPEKGKTRYGKDSVKLYRRPPIDLCMEFCKEHGIEPREHALAYEHFFPDWLADASVEEVKKALENRMREIAGRYADKIPTVEVTNEMMWPKGKTAFYDQPDFIDWCFETARKYFPKNQLVINEWHGACWGNQCRVTDAYYAYTEAAILRGAPIDAIGLQYHMFFKREDEYAATRTYYSPEQLYRRMDLYANLNKPLQITEVTIPAYSWEDEDENLQAEIIKNLYTVWFSHPAVEQIIYWNMVDGYAHVADADPAKIRESQGNMTVGENYYHGGLLRFDMTPKPAYYAIRELFEKVWHTEETLLTDENGRAAFRGFYGEYEIDVNGKTVTFDLDKQGKNEYALEVV